MEKMLYGDESAHTPPAFPHASRRNSGRRCSAWTPLLPCVPIQSNLCAILFLRSKSLTVASRIFPPLPSSQDCAHDEESSFFTPLGCEPGASRSCRSSGPGVERVSFHFGWGCVSDRKAATHLASFSLSLRLRRTATHTPGTVCDRTASILRCLVHP